MIAQSLGNVSAKSKNLTILTTVIAKMLGILFYGTRCIMLKIKPTDISVSGANCNAVTENPAHCSPLLHPW